MRVSKWGIGATLIAMTMLVGCSAPAGGDDEKKPESQSQASEKPADSTAQDCPELTEGATIEGSVLGTCIADHLKTIAGYAATTSTLGMETKARYNPADKAMETTSPMGSMILVDGAAYVKGATGDWQKADTGSGDPIIAGLSAAAQNVSALDPAAVAAALNGTFTVTGKGTRLGQEVFILTGKVQTNGASADTTYEVTADYASLATKSTAEANGMKVDSSMEVTEWDVKQDIVAPM